MCCTNFKVDRLDYYDALEAIDFTYGEYFRGHGTCTADKRGILKQKR